MGKKTDGEEDPDGWRCKPIGKKGRGKRNKENADDFASLPPSATRAGTAYHLPDVTKDVTKVDWVRQSLFAPRKTKETTAQPSTNTNAAHAVANAAAEEAAADATTHQPHDIARIHAELKLEQLSIGTTAAQNIANAAAEKAAAGADAPERAVAEQTVAINAVEQAAINADAEAAATINNLQEEIEHRRLLLTAERDATAAAKAAADEAAASISKLEVDNKRILLLLAAEQAATAVKVYVPG